LKAALARLRVAIEHGRIRTEDAQAIRRRS
jgi:hypothetical protein